MSLRLSSLLIALLFAFPVQAQENPPPIDMTPAPAVAAPQEGDGLVLDTVPPLTQTVPGELPAGRLPLLRLTPDKIDILKLDQDAVNVIVGNAAHLMAVMETPRQVLLIPRAPGATHLQVLNAKGESIVERAVIVAAPKQDYIRVRRACATAQTGNCQEYSVFYCPDMCHSVNVVQKNQARSTGITVPDEPASTGGTNNKTNAMAGVADSQPVPASAPSNTAKTMGNALMIP